MQITSDFCPIFRKSEFSTKYFRKTLKISNFTKISQVGGGKVLSYGRTDRHDAANSHFSQFCESSQKDGLKSQGHN